MLSYSWDHSKEESVYDFLGIYTKIFDGGVLKFYQTVLIHKVLEATRVDHINGLPTPTNIVAPLGTDDNFPDVDRDWTN